MPELYFRLGDMAGFTAKNLADRKPGFAVPIRELVQNALDASPTDDTCRVSIGIEVINKKSIPCIQDYKSALKNAKETQTEKGSYQAQQQRVVTKIQRALDSESITILWFSDDGRGMTPNKLEALLSERSLQDDSASSAGAYGVGHLSAYHLSALRYVLYATRYADDNGERKDLFTGSPILAGYHDGQAERGPVGRIVKKKPKSESDPKFEYLDNLDTFPPFIQNKMQRLQPTGTIVAILGLAEEWSEEAEYAIASHFFSALAYDKLNITVYDHDRATTFDQERVDELLRSKKDKQRRRKDENDILTGQQSWQSWLAVKSGTPKQVILPNGDKVNIYLKTDDVTSSSVALVRRDMLIARHDTMLSRDIESLRKNPEFLPFALVIDVEQHTAPELFSLVKGAEGLYHNELIRGDRGDRGDLSKEDENRMRALFKEISEKIKTDYLQKIERESFHLPLFQIPEKASEKSAGGNRNPDQTTRAKPRRPANPSPNLPGEGKGKKRPAPNVSYRALEARTAARCRDTGEEYKVDLYVTPVRENSQDDVWLAFCMDEDSDDGRTHVWLDFAAISMDGKALAVTDENNKQISLGNLTPHQRYSLAIRLHKPLDKVGNMKAALKPILNLKRKKKVSQHE